MKPRNYRGGMPPDVERMAWRERFGYNPSASGGSCLRWTDAFLNQLCHCKTDECRRILVYAMEPRERDKWGNYSRAVEGKAPMAMKRTKKGKFAGTPGPGRPAKRAARRIISVTRMVQLAQRIG